MPRLIKNQDVEKEIFSEQISKIKKCKNDLKLDIVFLLINILCIIYSFSFWYLLPLVVFFFNIKNHIFDYRFNRAIALMLEQSSSFSVSEGDSKIINSFW